MREVDRVKRKRPAKPVKRVKRVKLRVHKGESFAVGDKRVRIEMDRPYQAVVTITDRETAT